MLNFLLQKSIKSKSPERKFKNEQIDRSNKEYECACDLSKTKVSVLQYRAISYTEKKNICVTASKEKIYSDR